MREKWYVIPALLSVLAISMVSCGSIKQEIAETEAETVIQESATQETEEVEEAEEEPEETIELVDVNNWFVGDIWNTIVDFQWYVYEGSSSTGAKFDADFAYERYKKSLEDTEKYTNFIHENYPDIASTWDKMMEQVDLVNENLADGYEVGSEPIDVDLLNQYSDAFSDYCRENK